MELSSLLPIGITLIVVSIALAFGLQITGEVATDMCGDATLEHANGTQCYTCPNDTFNTWNTTALTCDDTTGGDPRTVVYLGGDDFNASRNGQEGLTNLTEKLPTIGLVVAAVIIIAILVKGFSNSA